MTDYEKSNKYNVLLNKRSRAFLNGLDNFSYSNLLSKILDLEKEPRPTGCVKLSVQNAYRIRWTFYRVLYTVDDKEHNVFVYEISKRKDAYKKR